MIRYEPVIGLEIHAQVSTKTKLFCGCDNDSFGKPPNSNTCEICMAFPGMLPVINKEAVKKGITTALALNCNIPEISKFDRKNYFYPDLPSGFQISQYDRPYSEKGWLEMETKNGPKKIGITRIHLENDAGKLTHVSGGTLCDYNRAGTPLMEIVSEPDLRSPDDAVSYAKEIQRILRYVGSSDADMEKGMMRFDINVSIRKKGEKTLGTKVEVKNLNSFRSLEKAILFEIQRQTELKEKNLPVVQETRGWDDAKGITISQRSKEEAHDYRYFPEPDLPPILQDAKEREKQRSMLPELPAAKKKRYVEKWKIGNEDARILTEEYERANFFERVVAICEDPKKAASYINTLLLGKMRTHGDTLRKSRITAESLGALIRLINANAISNNLAKGEVFEEMYNSGKNPETIIKEKGISEVNDQNELELHLRKILEENPKIVDEYRKGKTSVIGFFVGKIMRETQGSANPKLANDLVRKLLRNDET